MHKGRRITAAKLRSCLADLESLLRSTSVHAVDDALLARAGQISLEQVLQAYDAVHLAGALSFQQGEDVVFACWDNDLRKGAEAHGFTLLPEQT